MSFQASVVAKRHWKSWAERRDASLNSELAEAAITEETHVLHPSENNLGMNVYTTIINLSPGKKGLQHLLYIIKQNKFFYLGKFYSSKKKKNFWLRWDQLSQPWLTLRLKVNQADGSQSNLVRIKQALGGRGVIF